MILLPMRDKRYIDLGMKGEKYMFKKITAFLLAVAIVTSCAMTVFANPLGFPESRVEETSEIDEGT